LDLINYEEQIRKMENTEEAVKQKILLRKCSMKGAKIDVRLFVGQVPKFWTDDHVFNYFKKYGTVFEARIIRDK